LLTIDLTEAVALEARDLKADLIVAYHPPIFSGLKRLTQATANERIIARLVCDQIFVYSPHTALDCARGGVNDWLARAFAPASAEPIVPSQEGSSEGVGRRLTLAGALELDDIVARLKSHLAIDHVRVAHSKTGKAAIETVALCAGAGGSVLGSAPRVDLWLSGELRHHDILARVENGTHVIVCDHTHTERGYLPILAEQLRERLGDEVDFVVSAVDDDPLRVR
jgi:dinuclear metal center YbgI/SA1388 family protein